MNLPDIQQSHDNRGVTIQHAGIRNIEIPLTIEGANGKPVTIPFVASLSVGLSAEKKGVNMSRFVKFLSDLSKQELISLDSNKHLKSLKELLESESANLKLNFKHFLEKNAPVTGLSAPMSYSCEFEAGINENETECFSKFTVKVPVGNLCPCSKAISKYGAHNQRAIITVSVDISPEFTVNYQWISSLVRTIEEASSCPVYPILKREDEKYVTERQYENPKFVEDMVRDAALKLQDFPQLTSVRIEAEALESIHAHNAWASVKLEA